ncbi:MAG: S8 family peptidase [Muribaculaceae bacterium]|nr:S8 family peptidase [Muribaculaceae bacterium]
MRKFAVLIMFIVVSVINLSAQRKMDLRSTYQLKKLSVESIQKTEKYVSGVVKISDNAAIDELKSLGVKIINQRDELLLVFVPVSAIDDVLKIISVATVNIGCVSEPMMNNARAMSNVDIVNNGIDLPQKYDGSGVVVGFSDIGFDPNHINFKDNDGNSRVKRVVSYVDSSATIIDLTTPDDITNWQTDNLSQCHATIVAGVLTGSYKGNGYHGVAPGAEIVATTSGLYDGTILAGVENVVEYARRVGKPAIVNISIGSYIGPHDGSGLFSQYLDKIGEEAIICMSAGNEGARPNVLKMDFSSENNQFKTFVFDTKKWVGVDFGGGADFWSADSREFKVAVCIYDRITKQIVYTSPLVGGAELREWGMSSSDYKTDGDDNLNYFNGYVRISSELNTENNRYNILCSYYISNFEKDDVYGRYVVGIIIEGYEDVHVDGYADGSNSYFTSLGIEGFSNGQSDCTVSDMACGYNIIVVGSSNSKGKATTIAGEEKNYNITEGDISYYSSNGQLIDGRCLPHFCAPGAWVTSSISTPYVNQQSEEYKSSLATKTNVDDVDYYWITECGTSISSPLAAGVFALWLQANPDLTVDEVREIAMSTASHDVPDITNPQWGAGNLDALAGLKEVIKRVGVENVGIDKRVLFELISHRNIKISVIEAPKFDVKIFDIAGKIVRDYNFNADNGHVNLDSFGSGIYMFEIYADGYRHVEKIIVR